MRLTDSTEHELQTSAELIESGPGGESLDGARELIQDEVAHVRKRPNRPRELNESDMLTGLAVSGGGIRSASFALGVLQAIAERNRLSWFDYLSTVSGGGYSAVKLIRHKRSRPSSLNSTLTCKRKSPPSISRFDPFGGIGLWRRETVERSRPVNRKRTNR